MCFLFFFLQILLNYKPLSLDCQYVFIISNTKKYVCIRLRALNFNSKLLSEFYSVCFLSSKRKSYKKKYGNVFICKVK